MADTLKSLAGSCLSVLLIPKLARSGMGSVVHRTGSF